MARARNIKPSFFQNEDLAELSPLARLFFIGLWTESDYKGCVEFRPKRLKVRLLPYDDCDAEEIANNLERSGFITIYSVGGQRYLKIINFEKHQNPHKNERETGSEIPDIDQHQPQIVGSEGFAKTPEKNGTDRDENGTDRADSLLLIPSTLNHQPCSTAPPASPASQGELVEGDQLGKQETALQAACRETWGSYALAYSGRYGTEPVRNVQVSSKVKQFVQRIGFLESPAVAAFFVSHQDAFYVRKLHDFGLALKDAEKLRTEWATCRQVTGTQARQAEQTSSNFENGKAALAMLKAEGFH